MKKNGKKHQKRNVTDTKTGVTTVRVGYMDHIYAGIWDDKPIFCMDPVKPFWEAVCPGYKSIYTIDDFTGLRPINNENFRAKFGDKIVSIDETCHYMYSNNYYLNDRYGMGLTAVDDYKNETTNTDIYFDGKFTASDIYKIYNSLSITNISVVLSTLNMRCDFPTIKMENVAKEYAEAMVNDRERFMPMFKDCIQEHPEFCYGKSYEELANEYIDFAAPHVYNNFKCPISYSYHRVYDHWKLLQEEQKVA